MAPTIAVVLAPIDAGVANLGGRTGAAAGPRAVLDVLQSRGVLHDATVETLKAGNTPATLEEDLARLTGIVHRLSGTHDKVLTLGGDHGITFGAVAGAGRSRSLAAVAYVDVHWDLRPYPPHTSGSSFRRILDAALVTPARLHPVGVQRPADPAALQRSRFDELAAFAMQRGVVATAFEDAKRQNLTRVLTDRLDGPPGPRYLSIDMDAVDESEVCGVSAPGKGRFMLRELVRAAGAAAPLVVAADVVETAPALDPSGRSTEAAADVARAILQAWAKE